MSSSRPTVARIKKKALRGKGRDYRGSRSSPRDRLPTVRTTWSQPDVRILGGRETSRTQRPPGKKGVGSARRGPTRIRHRPSPPTCSAWFPRLRSPPLPRPASFSPTSIVTSQGTLAAVRCLGPTAPLLQLLCRARDPSPR